MTSDAMLAAQQLSVEFYPGETRQFYAVVEANLTVDRGEVVGLVGESGCGKSVTSMALVNLLPSSAHAEGTIEFNGDRYSATGEGLNDLRGSSVGMIFQEPMSALNPVYTVGEQLEETLRYLRGWDDYDRIRRESIDLLKRVHLDRPEDRLDSYPHQLSGGQRQRAMIALSLGGDPDLLIADEPTTALDVTLEAGIIKLFEELAADGLGILLISHDLGLIAEVSDRIVVMYSGYTVENGPARAMIEQPQHPYTRGLVAASTSLSSADRDRLPVIPGDVPDPVDRPPGCPFHPRCEEKESRCDSEFPSVFQPLPSVDSACWAREGGRYRDE